MRNGMMTVTVVMLGLCCVMSGALAGAVAPPPPPSKLPAFDMFVFSQFWPGSQCNLETACVYGDDPLPLPTFQLHGLWPSHSNPKQGGGPWYCDDADPLSFKQIKPLLPVMDVVWASFSPYGNNSGFWEHEWSKHGTCAKSVFPSQLDFFSGVLDLRLRNDLLTSLAMNAIVPSDTSLYTVADVANGVSNSYGVDNVMVLCNNGTDGVKQLNEIWMCIDLDLQPISCPAEYVAAYAPFMNCNPDDKLRYPVFTEKPLGQS